VIRECLTVIREVCVHLVRRLSTLRKREEWPIVPVDQGVNVPLDRRILAVPVSIVNVASRQRFRNVAMQTANVEIHVRAHQDSANAEKLSLSSWLDTVGLTVT